MEMQGRNKAYFSDAGDGALANFNLELQQIRRSQKRNCRIVAVVVLLLFLVLLALIIVAGTQARTIRRLKDRQGLLPHPNVTFASYSGDRKVNGLTYGGSLFRGSGFWSFRTPLPAVSVPSEDSVPESAFSVVKDALRMEKPLNPEPLTDHAAIGVGEVVYIIGGANETGDVLDQFLLFDPTFHNYTVLQSIPEPRYRFGAALLDNKIYVVGGRKDKADNEAALATAFYVYDIAKNEWFKGPDILEPHSDPCAAAISGKVYLVGGYDPSYVAMSKIQIFDPATNKWSYGPDMPTPRGDLMCAAFEDEIYVLGGYYDAINKTQPFSSKMESFSPVTSKWTTRPDLLTPRGDGAVAVLPGRKLLLIGGEGHYKNDDNLKYPKHTNEVYYGQDGTWVEKAMIPTARFRTAAATAGGLTFVFGGSDACIDRAVCPALDTTAVFLDVDHPHVYIYLKDDAYNDNAALTTYPV